MRSICQSLDGFAASRKRPSQSVVLGRNLLPRPMPPIGVPSRNAGCGCDIVETPRFHHRNTNIVLPSSSGTQARALTFALNSLDGCCVHDLIRLGSDLATEIVMRRGVWRINAIAG